VAVGLAAGVAEASGAGVADGSGVAVSRIRFWDADDEGLPACRLKQVPNTMAMPMMAMPSVTTHFVWKTW